MALGILRKLAKTCWRHNLSRIDGPMCLDKNRAPVAASSFDRTLGGEEPVVLTVLLNMQLKHTIKPCNVGPMVFIDWTSKQWF